MKNINIMNTKKSIINKIIKDKEEPNKNYIKTLCDKCGNRYPINIL